MRFNISGNNIILIGLFFRIILYVILAIFPFYHSKFGNISPISYHTFSDLSFYLNFGERDFNLSDFFFTYQKIFTLNISNIDNRFPGPLYPFILFLTSYEKSFTFFMSIVIFGAEVIAYILWSTKKFINQHKLSLIIFSFMPIPLYFGFYHSPDVIFYLLFTMLYFQINGKTNIKYVTLISILLVLLRPNSALILVGLIIYFSFVKVNVNAIKVSLILLFLSIIYYSPYFLFEIDKLNSLNFIFSFKSFIEFLLVYIKKIFYLIGFIPSGSGNFLFYILRCICASIFFIGLVSVFLNQNNTLDKIYTILFVFVTSTLFYPAYRYILPITPILIFYFCNLFLKKK